MKVKKTIVILLCVLMLSSTAFVYAADGDDISLKSDNYHYASAELSISSGTATVSSEAHKNEKNGVAFVVDYDEASTSGVGAYAKATCNASAEYRAILNSPSRTITVSTGTATCSHYVYGRDY